MGFDHYYCYEDKFGNQKVRDEVIDNPILIDYETFQGFLNDYPCNELEAIKQISEAEGVCLVYQLGLLTISNGEESASVKINQESNYKRYRRYPYNDQLLRELLARYPDNLKLCLSYFKLFRLDAYLNDFIYVSPYGDIAAHYED